MAELHARIYLKPPKSIALTALRTLFAAESKEAFARVARDISPEDGDKHARDFLSSIPSFEDLRSGRTRNVRAFATWQFVLGIDGASQTEKLLEFLLDLVPAAEAWAYVVTDDDPVETWFRAADGKVIQQENEPGQDSAEDREVIETIYAWWHDGLPKSISEGQLVEARDEVPRPRAVEHVITKTQITGVEDVSWENLYFNLIVGKVEELEPDWQKPGREMTEEGAARALRLLRALCANYRHFDVQIEGRGCTGSSGSIKFAFSTNSDSSLYALNYAAVCVQFGAKIKQFVSAHSDHEVHYLGEGERVVVEKRQGKAVLETTAFSIDQILELAESKVGQ